MSCNSRLSKQTGACIIKSLCLLLTAYLMQAATCGKDESFYDRVYYLHILKILMRICLQPGSYIGYFDTIGVWPLSRYDAWANFNHIPVLHSFVWNEDIASFYYIYCIFLDIGYIYDCKAHFREENFSYESLELSNLSKKLDYSSLGIILYSQQLVTALISISL